MKEKDIELQNKNYNDAVEGKVKRLQDHLDSNAIPIVKQELFYVIEETDTGMRKVSIDIPFTIKAFTEQLLEIQKIYNAKDV
jgi:hypothetical protein|tara:strand:- start:214 stop:459 length:246 start_codon:yes stop_codon:yes gene_type:complete